MRIVEHLQDLPDAEADALVGGAEQMPTAVPQGEPGEQPPGVRIEHGCALPRQIGQDHQTFAPRRDRRRLGHQHVERRAAGDLLQPTDHAASGRRARGQRQRAVRDARRRPQRGVTVVGVDDLNQEHRRAVHQHLITGIADARRERLRVRIDRARHHRRALRNAGRGRRFGMNHADDVAWPDQPRQRQVPADPLRPFVVPVELARHVQRIALTGGVVIEHVLAGQLGGDVRVRPVPAGRPLEHPGFVAPHPFQLRPDGLARQQRTCPLQNRVGAEFSSQRVDLGARAGVDAVQDRRT